MSLTPSQQKKYMVACELPSGRVEEVLSVKFGDPIEKLGHLEKLISTMVYSSISIHVLSYIAI